MILTICPAGDPLGSDSPDGILFHVLFDSNRLGKQLLALAIAHMGTHIADIRSTEGVKDIDAAESRAWHATFSR